MIPTHALVISVGHWEANGACVAVTLQELSLWGGGAVAFSCTWTQALICAL